MDSIEKAPISIIIFLSITIIGYGQSAPYFDVFEVANKREILDGGDDHIGVTMDANGLIWIGTHKGLYKFDGKDFYEYDIWKDKFWFKHVDVDNLVADSIGNVWVATRGQGVWQINANTEDMTCYSDKPESRFELLSNYCCRLFLDESQNLWIPHGYGKGVTIINPQTGFYQKLEDISEDKKNGENIPIFKGKNNDSNIYVNSIRGLCILDTVKLKKTLVPDRMRDLHALNHFADFFVEEDGTIWLGNWFIGLSRYHPDSNSVENFLDIENHAYKTYNKENGLYEIRITKESPFDASFEPTMVTGVYPLNDSILLLANYSIRGLHLFNKNTLEFSKFNLDKNWMTGDITPNGTGIFPDHYGRFWIPSRRSVHFGYKNIGIYVLDPTTPIKDNPPIRFSKFKVNNEFRTFDKQLTFMEQIELKKGEDNFTITFVFLNYSKPEDNIYQYRLEGYETEWHSTDQNDNSDTYSNLPPGNYTFHVTAANTSNECKNEKGTRLDIVIPAYWYETLWGKGLIGLVLGGIVFLMNRYQKRQAEYKAKLQYEQQEAKRLRELDEMKSNLFTNITHEFRTPLTVIKGMADELPDELYQKERIARNSDNLLRMVNQMLDLAKLESGLLKLNWVQDDMVQFLQYQTDAWSSYAEQKHIHLNFHSPTESLFMDMDRERLQQVITNLITNAIKFTPKYGKVNVSAAQKGATLFIKVKDSGVGIPKKDLPFLFDRFYQVDNQPTTEMGGTGIGLALVKELMSSMQGEVTVKSEVGKGSEFILSLPITTHVPRTSEGPPKPLISETKTERLAGTKSENQPSNQPSSLPSVLIIEDNNDVAFYIERILQTAYLTTHVRNGKLGVESATAHIPDLILCDVMMPEMDGFEVCEKLKEDERTSHIPIILLTAKATQDDKIEGLEHGADAYLTKPFDKRELLVRVEKLLQKQQRLQSYFTKNATLPKEEIIENEFLQKVFSVIEENYHDETFDLLRLCRAVHLERTQLYRKIKALTNLSPSQLIRKIRIEKAKKLLLGTNSSIAEIAYQCGFKNTSHFSKIYKEYFGESPNATRK